MTEQLPKKTTYQYKPQGCGIGFNPCAYCYSIHCIRQHAYYCPEHHPPECPIQSYCDGCCFPQYDAPTRECVFCGYKFCKNCYHRLQALPDGYICLNHVLRCYCDLCAQIDFNLRTYYPVSYLKCVVPGCSHYTCPRQNAKDKTSICRIHLDKCKICNRGCISNGQISLCPKDTKYIYNVKIGLSKYFYKDLVTMIINKLLK